MKKALHFGAGNIGRGFIGLLLSKSGYHVTFVDILNLLVDDINALKKYHVQITGKSEQILVENISAIDSDDNPAALTPAIVEADIITTAIGPNSLKFIAPQLAQGLIERLKVNKNPLNIIACENMFGSSTALKNLVCQNLPAEIISELDKFVGFPDAAVDRIVPNQIGGEKLLVTVEEFSEWDIDASQVVGDLSDIQGLSVVENLNAYIDRKIFTINTGHAAIAYLAYQKGIADISTAMKDTKILETARDVWAETSALLIDKYKFAPAAHRHYVQTTENRFANPNLSDEVSRVARNPIRKLSASDRIISPASQLIERGIVPETLAKVAAAAFKFNAPEDKEAVDIQNFIQSNGIDAAISNYTALNPNSNLFRLIKKHF